MYSSNKLFQYYLHTSYTVCFYTFSVCPSAGVGVLMQFGHDVLPALVDNIKLCRLIRQLLANVLPNEDILNREHHNHNMTTAQ